MNCLIFAIYFPYLREEVTRLVFCVKGQGWGGLAPWTQVIIIALGQDYRKANNKICSGVKMYMEQG